MAAAFFVVPSSTRSATQLLPQLAAVPVPSSATTTLSSTGTSETVHEVNKGCHNNGIACLHVRVHPSTTASQPLPGGGGVGVTCPSSQQLLVSVTLSSSSVSNTTHAVVDAATSVPVSPSVPVSSVVMGAGRLVVIAPDASASSSQIGAAHHDGGRAVGAPYDPHSPLALLLWIDDASVEGGGLALSRLLPHTTTQSSLMPLILSSSSRQAPSSSSSDTLEGAADSPTLFTARHKVFAWRRVAIRSEDSSSCISGASGRVVDDSFAIVMLAIDVLSADASHGSPKSGTERHVDFEDHLFPERFLSPPRSVQGCGDGFLVILEDGSMRLFTVSETTRLVRPCGLGGGNDGMPASASCDAESSLRSRVTAFARAHCAISQSSDFARHVHCYCAVDTRQGALVVARTRPLQQPQEQQASSNQRTADLTMLLNDGCCSPIQLYSLSADKRFSLLGGLSLPESLQEVTLLQHRHVSHSASTVCMRTVSREGRGVFLLTVHAPVAAAAASSQTVAAVALLFAGKPTPTPPPSSSAQPPDQSVDVMGFHLFPEHPYTSTSPTSSACPRPPCSAQHWITDDTFGDVPTDCEVCLCPLLETDDDDDGQTSGGGTVITLDCGHAFHQACLEGCLAQSEAYLPKGHRIVFNMARCPAGCGVLARHARFPDTERIANRHDDVLRDATARAAAEFPGVAGPDAMAKYLHYVCNRCQRPFWGGNKDCAASVAGESTVDPSELVCIPCRVATFSSARGWNHGNTAQPPTLFATASTPLNDFDRHAVVVTQCCGCCNPATHLSFGRLFLCERCVAARKVSSSKTSSPFTSSAVCFDCLGPAHCPFRHSSKEVAVAQRGTVQCAFLTSDGDGTFSANASATHPTLDSLFLESVVGPSTDQAAA